MKSSDFLDQIRRRHRLPSDYAVAKLLGVTTQRVSMYRCGRREFDDLTAVRVAQLLDVVPGYVLAEIQAERAQDRDVRRVWRALARMLRDTGKKSTAAALVLVAITALSNGPSASASDDKGLSEAAGRASYTLRALRLLWAILRGLAVVPSVGRMSQTVIGLPA